MRLLLPNNLDITNDSADFSVKYIKNKFSNYNYDIRLH